jgi:hypothetical protein
VRGVRVTVGVRVIRVRVRAAAAAAVMMRMVAMTAAVKERGGISHQRQRL